MLFVLRASEMIGLPIYTVAGKEIGRAFDLIINLPEGRVERITLEPIAAASREAAKRVFMEKTVSYSSIKAVGEIIIVSSEPVSLPPEPAALNEKERPHSYRHRFGRR